MEPFFCDVQEPMSTAHQELIRLFGDTPELANQFPHRSGGVLVLVSVCLSVCPSVTIFCRVSLAKVA